MGLTQKILLFTGLMIVALVGTTLAFTTVQADRLARTTIQEALADTRTVWESFQADRFANLKARLGALANDPYLKPLVEAAVEQDEGSSLADTLKERAADIRPDLFLATGPGGVVVARADGQEAGQDLSGDPLVSGALEQGKPAGTLWRQGSRLYHAVSAPMVTGEDTKGVLVAGYEVNQALAEQLRKLTHCEIAFVSEGAGQRDPSWPPPPWARRPRCSCRPSRPPPRLARWRPSASTWGASATSPCRPRSRTSPGGCWAAWWRCAAWRARWPASCSSATAW